MGSKFIDALKCFIRYPADTTRLMLGSYEQETIELIKKEFPEVEIESLGFYFGALLALIFLLLCVISYIMWVLYSMGTIG
ncbi:MAG: hypothetical protein U9O85_05080 [Euryarchaeota archaeon]|nr:hypothetical protein [Euryarchaeota archaeon]